MIETDRSVAELFQSLGVNESLPHQWTATKVAQILRANKKGVTNLRS